MKKLIHSLCAFLTKQFQVIRKISYHTIAQCNNIIANTFVIVTILLFAVQLDAQWKQLEVGPPGQVWSLGKMGNFIFAGTVAGIYRSTDQGKSWTNMASYFGKCFAVKGTQIFAGTQYNGIVCSADSGKTWQMTDTSLHREIDAIAFEGNYIFAGGGAVMLRSSDDGSSWETIQNGLQYGQTTVTGMVVTEGKILASTFAGVVVSTDDGDNWSTLVGTGQANQVTNCVAVIDSTVLVGWAGGIIRSPDDGRSWYDPQGYIKTATIFSIAGDSLRIYAGTTDGVHVSTDDGVTWIPVNNGLPGEQGWYLTKNEMNLFAADGDFGVYASSDSGFSWAQTSQGISGWTGEYLAGNESNIFATISSPTGGSQLLYHSTDNGNSWIQDTSLHGTWIQSITVTDSYVYAITNSGIFASSDNGDNWSAINGGIMDTVYPVSLAESNSNLIVATQEPGILFLSSDNGISWINVGKNLPRMGPLAAADNYLFAGNEGDWTSSNDGIYQSTDNGLNWSLINDTLINISSIAMSGSSIIAARYVPPFPVGSPLPPPSGVFLSKDNGETWKTLMTGLPINPHVNSLTIHGKNIFVVLSGAYGNYSGPIYSSNLDGQPWTPIGQGLPIAAIYSVFANDSSVFVGSDVGIWRVPISDVTAIREPKGSVLPDSYKLEQNYPNPFNPTTIIKYSLPQESKVTLRIYDILGRKIETLVNKHQLAGIHIVEFNGSHLASGIYFYRIQAGNFIDTKKLVLIK